MPKATKTQKPKLKTSPALRYFVQRLYRLHGKNWRNVSAQVGISAAMLCHFAHGTKRDNAASDAMLARAEAAALGQPVNCGAGGTVGAFELGVYVSSLERSARDLRAMVEKANEK